MFRIIKNDNWFELNLNLKSNQILLNLIKFDENLKLKQANQFVKSNYFFFKKISNTIFEFRNQINRYLYPFQTTKECYI